MPLLAAVLMATFLGIDDIDDLPDLTLPESCGDPFADVFYKALKFIIEFIVNQVSEAFYDTFIKFPLASLRNFILWLDTVTQSYGIFAPFSTIIAATAAMLTIFGAFMIARKVLRVVF